MMKPKRIFPPLNFTLLALAVALAGTLLFTGCASTDHGGASASDHAGHQGSCH